MLDSRSILAQESSIQLTKHPSLLRLQLAALLLQNTGLFLHFLPAPHFLDYDGLVLFVHLRPANLHYRQRAILLKCLKKLLPASNTQGVAGHIQVLQRSVAPDKFQYCISSLRAQPIRANVEALQVAVVLEYLKNRPAAILRQAVLSNSE